MSTLCVDGVTSRRRCRRCSRRCPLDRLLPRTSARHRSCCSSITDQEHARVLSRHAALGLGVFGFATCCLGFLLLAIPYVGTVLLLPLLVAYRYLSLEFLAQFDPSLDVFAVPSTEP